VKNCGDPPTESKDFQNLDDGSNNEKTIKIERRLRRLLSPCRYNLQMGPACVGDVMKRKPAMIALQTA
jgi:hypothetical protein